MVRGDPSPTRIRVLTAAIIVGVFASGAVVGAGLYRWGSSGGSAAEGPSGHGVGLWIPAGELDLTPEQHTEVSRIVERHRLELEATVRESFPRVRAINERMHQAVKAVLTPEQQKKFEALERRGPLVPTPTWQKRFEDSDRQPGPAPAGPLRTPGAP
jgi:Spy/CpxP family protein refolding chaperone